LAGSPDGDKLVALDPLARIQEQHNKAFAFRGEIWMVGDVYPPKLKSIFAPK